MAILLISHIGNYKNLSVVNEVCRSLEIRYCRISLLERKRNAVQSNIAIYHFLSFFIIFSFVIDFSYLNDELDKA